MPWLRPLSRVWTLLPVLNNNVAVDLVNFYRVGEVSLLVDDYLVFKLRRIRRAVRLLLWAEHHFLYVLMALVLEAAVRDRLIRRNVSSALRKASILRCPYPVESVLSDRLQPIRPDAVLRLDKFTSWLVNRLPSAKLKVRNAYDLWLDRSVFRVLPALSSTFCDGWNAFAISLSTLCSRYY